jgi:hypothetical protein
LGVVVEDPMEEMRANRVVRVVVGDMVRMVVVKRRVHKGMVLVMLVVGLRVRPRITVVVVVVLVELDKLVPQLIWEMVV